MRPHPLRAAANSGLLAAEAPWDRQRRPPSNGLHRERRPLPAALNCRSTRHRIELGGGLGRASRLPSILDNRYTLWRPAAHLPWPFLSPLPSPDTTAGHLYATLRREPL